jgi:predicted nucleic acid-binding protein
MKKVFVDTNILVDLIADRKPFSKFAVQIFSRAEKRKLKLYASSHSLATTHYLLKKYMDEKDLRDVLLNLLDYLHVVAIGHDVIRKGLRSSHKDFEDAIQIISAGSVENLDCIVTRNIKDFKGAEIPVMSPDELVSRFKSQD